MPKTVIHTFNARSNALLQIVRADGSFSLQAMRDEIQVAYQVRAGVERSLVTPKLSSAG